MFSDIDIGMLQSLLLKEKGDSGLSPFSVFCIYTYFTDIDACFYTAVIQSHYYLPCALR